jgi:hypothetical protein
MRFGESYGEACRFCGSTQIIVWPPSSAGNCANCSPEALAWDARLDQLARRRLEQARAAFAAAEAEKRAAELAARREARRAAIAGAIAASRAAAAGRFRAAYLRQSHALARLLLRARRYARGALTARSGSARTA